jgi:hypothetical protein
MVSAHRGKAERGETTKNRRIVKGENDLTRSLGEIAIDAGKDEAEIAAIK